MIRVQCPAKINLTLKVLRKRDDGFHDIESIMQTIDLFDYLTISAEPAANTEIILSGTSDEIPYDERNLVYKAAELFLKKIALVTTKRLSDAILHASPMAQRQKKAQVRDDMEIKIHIEKNIPVSAGLAGGSTDAAGTLYGLNEIFGNPLSRAELHELCAKLGSDLNFCLEGGRQLAQGRGEILTPLEFEEFSVSLLKPLDLGISAKEAYGKLKHYPNDLESAIIDDYPQLRKIKSLYPDAVMSGSGPTYFLVNKSFEPLEGYWLKNNLKSISYGIEKAP